MKRLSTLAVPALGAALSLLVLGGTAQAATPGRLVGQDLLHTITVTSSTEGSSVGNAYYVFWDFTRTCSAGTCVTRFSHPMDDWITPDVGFRLRLVDGVYRGSGTYPSPCYDDHGGIVEDRAYSETEKLAVRPTRVVNGKATAWTGTYSVTRVRTAAGTAAGCAAGGTTAYTVSHS